MKTVNKTLGLGILALLTVWSCTVEEMETPRQAVLVDPLPAARSYYDLEKPKQGNFYGRIQSDLEVFPYWEGAKSYSEGQILIVPAHRKVKATYAQGYLRRMVFQLDEAGQVIRGGILEMAGKEGAFLLENEEVLIEGFLSGVKSSQLTYLWSDFGSNPLDAIQSSGQKVERSVDRLLNSRRGLENFSTENCIDWYWVYSISGVVIYEEYSHTTCPGEGCSSGLRTNSQDACLDEGTPSGGGDYVDLKCNELMNTHGENFQDVNSFENQNLGLTYYDVIEQRPNNGWDFTNSQWGGPNIRYVSDPLNPSIKIDLRHMLIVGAMGRTIGNSIEVMQGINGETSAYDYQDYYSNELGYKFFEIYRDAINNNPYQFVTYLKQFLLSRMYRNEISNPDRCLEGSQG